MTYKAVKEAAKIAHKQVDLLRKTVARRKTMMANVAIVETVDHEWMVLIGGVQWGKPPRDRSGASDETWPTYEEAKAAIEGDQWN